MDLAFIAEWIGSWVGLIFAEKNKYLLLGETNTDSLVIQPVSYSL